MRLRGQHKRATAVFAGGNVERVPKAPGKFLVFKIVNSFCQRRR